MEYNDLDWQKATSWLITYVAADLNILRYTRLKGLSS